MAGTFRVAAILFITFVCLNNVSAQGFGNNEALLNALRNRSSTPAAVNPGSSQRPPASAAQAAPDAQYSQPKARWNQQTQNALTAPTAAANAFPGGGAPSGVDPDKLRNIFRGVGR